MAFVLQVQFTQIDCGRCGGVYAINERYRANRHEEGKSWNCPYCQCCWGYAEGENDKLKKEVAAKQARIDQLNAAVAAKQAEIATKEKQAERQRREAARLRKRAKCGVCPCCNRSFQALSRHMKSKHPDYAAAPAT
jgi:hypothetical protein